MKIYATTDTHFGHDRLQLLSGRPADFGEKLLKSISSIQADILIHCGDFCIGKDDEHTTNFMAAANGFEKKILVKGNHDNKSDNWYYERGWDFVCYSTSMKIFGKHVLFTHIPILQISKLQGAHPKYDMNIHGHFHGGNDRANRKIELYNHAFHYDLAPERHDYKIVNLEKII